MDFSHEALTIRNQLVSWEQKLIDLPAETISQVKNKQNRTIKQLLGHLIDSASNNHQRMVRLQYNKELTFPDYQQDNDLWIALQDYQHADWFSMIQLWKFYNLHIVHIINSLDPGKVNNRWKNYNYEIITLEVMIKNYPHHNDIHLKEIQELIEQKQQISY